MRHTISRSGGMAGVMLVACAHAPADEAHAQAPAPPAADAAPAPSSTAEAPVPRIRLSGRRLQGRVGRTTTIRGRVTPGASGRLVLMQVRRANSWRSLARARTRAGGAYILRVRPRRASSARARLLVPAGRGFRRAARGAGRFDVYRPAAASWYGPGLFGNGTGCGGTLTAGSVGVAHKRLPCGVRVTLKHRGRTMRVPVIDRGPYVGGREFDLTQAVARRLRFQGHGTVLVTR